VLIELYDAMENVLRERSSLDDATRQAIHLAVANANACEYCEAAYTGAARRAGFSADQAADIRRGSVSDGKLDALLRVCREIAEHNGYVQDATWKAAVEAGWSERQILEAYADVVRTVLTKYFNHLVGTELDLPPAPGL
jgi:AhpD family alkylhydroperoxidase